jgi:DNA repair protein RadA/Sms
MAKTRVTFLCKSCGSSHPRWMGKCPDCGTWDALEKFVPPAEEPQHQALGAVAAWIAHGDQADGHGAGLADLKSVALPLDRVSPLEAPRIATGIGELDRVLGGGVVPGSAVLVGGDPGIGKSTLLLQAAACMSDAGQRVLYVSSEESAQQVKMRAERVLVGEEGASPPRGRMSDLFILSETNLSRIAEQARRVKPALLVIDSIQMLWSSAVEAAPGSATQLRRACLELVTLAKASEMAVAMVGHVTKEGELAGPKLLEHLVDVVVQFEGDRHHAHRVVRALKNRFGSTQEIGLFEMTGSGLAEIREGSLSLGDGDGAGPRPGTIHVPSLAGSRCLIAEMQALTAGRAASTPADWRCLSPCLRSTPGCGLPIRMSSPKRPADSASSNRPRTCRSRWRSPVPTTPARLLRPVPRSVKSASPARSAAFGSSSSGSARSSAAADGSSWSRNRSDRRPSDASAGLPDPPPSRYSTPLEASMWWVFALLLRQWTC